MPQNAPQITYRCSASGALERAPDPTPIGLGHNHWHPPFPKILDPPLIVMAEIMFMDEKPYLGISINLLGLGNNRNSQLSLAIY